jgi:hypothetical protein
MRSRVGHDSLDKGTLPLLLALSNPLANTRSCEVRVWQVAPHVQVPAALMGLRKDRW